MRLSPERMGAPTEGMSARFDITGGGGGGDPDDDVAVNARSQEVTIADGGNTHGKVNQHPASDAQGFAPPVAGLSMSPDASSKPALHSDEHAGGAPAAEGGGAGSSSKRRSSRSSSSAVQESGGGEALLPFRVGMSEDRNKRWRRTMEDSHAFVYGFGGVHGQGFFSVFDGHAGKHSAEWCGQHFHEYLLNTLTSKPDMSVPDILNETFHQADRSLSKLAQEQGSSSGCTAVTALLRLEDEHGVPVTGKGTGGVVKGGSSGTAVVGGASSASFSSASAAAAGAAVQSGASAGSGGSEGKADADAAAAGEKGGTSASASTSTSSSSHHGHGLFSAFSKKHRAGHSSGGDTSGAAGDNGGSSVSIATGASAPAKPSLVTSNSGLVTVTGQHVRRVLYTANVGDARAVLCRGGRAIRLTYDHKGSDAQEAKRITDAGGFVMNNRVNGVLAVTRSLGDSSMKEFVVGAPYTTETTLGEDDTFLIVACDGLWDVVDDQDAVDLIKDVEDPQKASDQLLRHALSNFSTDNTSVMVVRFAARPQAISDPHQPDEST